MRGIGRTTHGCVYYDYTKHALHALSRRPPHMHRGTCTPVQQRASRACCRSTLLVSSEPAAQDHSSSAELSTSHPVHGLAPDFAALERLGNRALKSLPDLVLAQVDRRQTRVVF